MSLHPVLNEKLNAAVAPGPELVATRRDAGLPAIPGKVHAVVGMRRAGKTTYLRQLQSQWRTSAEAARVVYLSFDDDRLADLPLEQLGMLLEEYYRRRPTQKPGSHTKARVRSTIAACTTLPYFTAAERCDPPS